MGIAAKKQGKEKIDINQYIALEEELIATKKKYGIEETEGRAANFISRFFDKRDGKEPAQVDRKKYLLLAVFTGWMGGHRFYAKQYPTAILYLLLFWTGFPLAMTLIDLMAALPKDIDADGKILI